MLLFPSGEHLASNSQRQEFIDGLEHFGQHDLEAAVLWFGIAGAPAVYLHLLKSLLLNHRAEQIRAACSATSCQRALYVANFHCGP
jgi:hypothetical protein